MIKNIKLSKENIELKSIFKYFEQDFSIELDENAVSQIEKSQNYLINRLKERDEAIYGINTGFGSLCDVRISDNQIEQLQEKLILSHACGTGAEIPQEISRLIQLLKIKNLSFGYSGVRKELVEKLIAHFNAGITPIIYELGSLGASGDLAPLSHMSLPLFGKGEVIHKGEKKAALDAMKTEGIEPISLSVKEGLALINGTQFSLAFGIHAAYHCDRIAKLSSLIAGLSIEGYNGMKDPYYHRLHEIRKQEGQARVAKQILNILKGSENLEQEKYNVQDPYSFRCIPQVHGASLDAINYFSTIVERELNSVTDNPNIFADEDRIISGGNFHAQPLALALDFLSIAISEIANISERRIFKLINGDRELPQFLTKFAGLNSGFMIVQYTAASVVNQNKHLANPVSTDSIVSSRGQEDHVSMGANAATKNHKLIDNVYRVLSMELMAAAQAVDFRDPSKLSPITKNLYQDFRKEVEFLGEDREMYLDMEKSFQFCKTYKIPSIDLD